MNLKNMLLTGAVALGLNSCGPTNEEIAQRQNDIKDTFKKEYLKQDPRIAREALEKTTDIDSAGKRELNEEINRQPNDSIYTIDMDRIRKGALGKSRKINHNFSVLLGGKRADSVMQEYNKEVLTALNIKPGQSIQRRGFEGAPDIKVPMVYPTLKDFFVPSLKDFLADKPEIAQQVGDTSEVIIVTRAPDGNHSIGYYRDGHIFLAAYMSGGVGKDAKDMDHRL